MMAVFIAAGMCRALDGRLSRQNYSITNKCRFTLSGMQHQMTASTGPVMKNQVLILKMMKNLVLEGHGYGKTELLTECGIRSEKRTYLTAWVMPNQSMVLVG